MPGLTGIISDKTELKLFQTFLNKLDYYNYKIELFQDRGIHLGKVHLNYINNSPQPVFTKDKRYALLMYGEIFSYDCIETDQIKDNGEFLLGKFIKNGVNCFI